MSWKDNCPSCGGHPNQDGNILHRVKCENAELVLAKPETSPQHLFEIGVLTSLVIIEARVLMRPEDTDDGGWDATPELIERAIKIVAGRFDRLRILDSLREQMIVAAMKELEHGI